MILKMGVLPKKFNFIFGFICVFFIATILSACKAGGSSNNNSGAYPNVVVPATTYPDGKDYKFAVYTSAGNGKQTLTEIDTGSDLYLIESSYAGNDIYYTGESITLKYDHGNVTRSGVVGYTYVTFLNLNGQNILTTTTNKVPVLVVPDGVISESQNHAIMGMRMDGNVSVRLFLPYPYNQMFMMDMPQMQLIFNNFSSQQMESFGFIQAPESACNTYSVQSTSNNKCWNDMNLPVNYVSTHNGVQFESTIFSLFDSGASTSFQLHPLPDWLVIGSNNNIKNPVSALAATTKGPMELPLTIPADAYDTNYNGYIVNVGNNIFNYYQILYNQTNGKVGLRRVANPDTTTVTLVYKLQGESMGLHIPLLVGNNQIYAGVDTGSVGLRVLESAIPNKTGIQISSEQESYSYEDGVSLSSVVATAPITIGGVTENIKFMIITNVSCVPQKPNCPKNAFSASGRAGLMGISLFIGGSTHGVWSTLSQLPGSLANGFYLDGNLSSPGLTIGLTSKNTTGFDYINLASITQPQVNPAPYNLWEVNLPASVEYPSVGDLTILKESGYVLYDTGTAAYTIYNVESSQQSTFSNGATITQKQQLNTVAFNWSFNTGGEYYINSAVKSSESFPLIVNTGNIPFTMYNILYNVESGKMGFR